ncbi:MAG: peptidoglycan-binding domain-containing protein [Pyrinomonadaceae bacterium]
MGNYRYLYEVEKNEARKVFADSLDYRNITINDLGGGQVVTIAGRKTDNWNDWAYSICWSPAVVNGGVIPTNNNRTFIHEMTHVWQGQHGAYPTNYMFQSLFSQLVSGIGDIIKKREWRTWGEHRGATYIFAMSDIGKNWNEFNVEQQANIIESWHIAENDRRGKIDYGEGVYGGGASQYDARFSYIRDVIRAGNRNAIYQPIRLAQGADVEIKRMQDKLAALGCLAASNADGIISRGNSPTKQAVRAFQMRNGLKPDGDLGGVNSETRKKLQLPISQLTAAQ